MKKLLAFLFLLIPFFNFARDKGIDQKIDETFGSYTSWFVDFIFMPIPFSKDIQVPWVLIVLIGAAVSFTIYFRFINVRGFKTAINIVRGKYDELESGEDHIEASEDTVHTVDGDIVDTIRVEQKEGEHHGEVSHFQALTAALSATVGLGNIAGVAVALSVGGPGATFWMIVAGLIGMASKFTECTLGVKYREIDKDGKVFGGPMYYLKKGLRDKKMANFGRVLAVIFAIMCIGGSFGGGNMFQSNQAFAMLESYGSTKASEYENLSETVGEQVKYNFYTEETITIESVKKDSITYKKGDESVTVSNETMVGDSTRIGTTDETIKKDTDFETLVGENVIIASPQSLLYNVESVENGEVTLVYKDEKKVVSEEEFKAGGVVTPLTGYGFIFGIVMAILVGIVIIGGIKKIAKVTDKIVPFMVAIYVLAAMTILIMKGSEIPRAFGQIFEGAFTGLGIAGGVFGVLIQGFQRAAFSNEAGIGSASIAHSAVKTKYAASEGLVALLEPFIDTVLVCTMTALVLIITNGDGSIMEYGTKVSQGVEVTSAAFGSVFSFFPLILTIAVILFAFSSMISWSYYGYQAWTFLFGRDKKVEYAYKALFCVFVVVGAASQLDSVMGFSDAMIFAMLVPNMIGLFILAPVAGQELKKFMGKVKELKAR
ncbi:alanine:cation symporter family protein [Paracrocinitomix mangrovi]|uniref:alanine/glycine:cation symporter family protein n=1 Tax=Paracrocinitomix mangrovi TaxID=2862509 RepID=UPI001EDBADB3|nr:alanine/glycine:cation symporter family protein [Paracrocinitomix mangrovi]UKN01018.1 alanine:cation symporter family protein [Paracrocinitomix mangrovi]